jgi:hypothetical protein
MISVDPIPAFTYFFAGKLKLILTGPIPQRSSFMIAFTALRGNIQSSLQPHGCIGSLKASFQVYCVKERVSGLNVVATPFSWMDVRYCAAIKEQSDIII